MKSISKIAVLGGGNIGTYMAAICASKGYKVRVFTSKPELYDGILESVDENGNVIIGKIECATNNIKQAVENAELIFITQPAFMLEQVAEQIYPYVTSKTNICVMPGTGGAEFAFHKCIQAGATLHGFQRVPVVARLIQYGKRVRGEGKRTMMANGSIPKDAAKDFAEFMTLILDIPCKPLPNYLSVTLTPSNPILHTTRLCTLFADYKNGKVYDKNPLFYGEWSDESSELLFKCDEELQSLLIHMPKMDLSNVISLKIHYENDKIPGMTAKMRSIKSLQNLTSPMKSVSNGWVPDFESRYFIADFPFGLALIESLADVLGVDVPYIRKTMKWYQNATGDTRHFNIKTSGIHNVNDIYEFYHR